MFVDFSKFLVPRSGLAYSTLLSTYSVLCNRHTVSCAILYEITILNLTFFNRLMSNLRYKPTVKKMGSVITE